MNISNYNKYIKISKSIANNIFKTHKETFVCNSISRKDLIAIANKEMYSIIANYAKKIYKKNKQNITLEGCIKVGVIGKIYNVINRECIRHNKLITYMPYFELAKIKSDAVLIYPDKLENNYFDIEELAKCLDRTEYKIMYKIYVKNHSITKIAKKINKSRVFITKKHKEILKKIKNFLIVKKAISTF